MLLHVPPPVTSDNATVAPAHSNAGPVIGAGIALTVTTPTTVQVVGAVYVMFTVPATLPAVTIPEVLPIVTSAFALDHVPPEPSMSVVEPPAQTARLPEIPAGNELTVTTTEVKQPAPTVYTIVAVPADPPAVTIPLDEPMVTVASDVLHTPPEGI